MYLFHTLTRQEKRLIIVLTLANLLIMGLLFAGARSHAAQTDSLGIDAQQVTPVSKSPAPDLEDILTPEP